MSTEDEDVVLLLSLTREQREAVYRWLRDEADWTGERPSYTWERQWLSEAGKR